MFSIPIRTFLVSAFIAAGMSSASAALYNLSGVIDGAQSGTGSPGTGNILGSYDDVTNLLSWNVTWAGLIGSATVSHFHGPAAPGSNAGVQQPFNATSPSIGSATITGLQGSDLIDGLWYANIHSDVDPGGEIRGQVNATLVPEPSGSLLAALAGFLVLCRRRR